MYPIPLLFEKWYLRWAPRKPFGLAELLRETAGKASIFLDLKNGGEEAAQLIRRALDDTDTPVRIAASSQQWTILRSVHSLLPEVDTFYSIDVAAKLDLFVSVFDRDRLPRGISCRHSLLTRAIVERLHERGLLVVAWTVDDLARAAELHDWGVDGITTHRVQAVRETLGLER